MDETAQRVSVEDSSRVTWQVLAVLILPFVIFYAELASNQVEWSVWNLINYTSAAVFVAATWHLVCDRVPGRSSLRRAVWLLAIAGFIGWAWIDTYEEWRVDDWGTVITTRRAWGNRPLYEEMRSPPKEVPSWLSHGPVAPSGARQGEWTILEGGGLRREWYWYDEEVSEGEWHRLNR